MGIRGAHSLVLPGFAPPPEGGFAGVLAICGLFNPPRWILKTQSASTVALSLASTQPKLRDAWDSAVVIHSTMSAAALAVKLLTCCLLLCSHRSGYSVESGGFATSAPSTEVFGVLAAGLHDLPAYSSTEVDRHAYEVHTKRKRETERQRSNLARGRS